MLRIPFQFRKKPRPWNRRLWNQLVSKTVRSVQLLAAEADGAGAIFFAGRSRGLHCWGSPPSCEREREGAEVIGDHAEGDVMRSCSISGCSSLVDRAALVTGEIFPVYFKF